MSHIQVFKIGSNEFTKLELAAQMMTNHPGNKKHRRFWAGDTYSDYGRGSMWTTILAAGDWIDFQAISPATQKRILDAETADDIEAIVNDFYADGHYV